MIWVVIAIVAVVVVGVVLVSVARGRRSTDGVESFQRHIDALSPEARRSVVDRVQRRRTAAGDSAPGVDHDATDAPHRDDGGVDGS